MRFHALWGVWGGGGESVMEIELFMIIKLDVTSSAVKIPFSSFNVSYFIVMCANFNDKNRWLHLIYSRLDSAVLL